MDHLKTSSLVLTIGVCLGALIGPVFGRLAPVAEPERREPTPVIATPADRMIHLAVRDVVQRNDSDVRDTETDWELVDEQIEFNASRAALLLVDVWALHPSSGVAERMNTVTSRKIAPLLDAWREAGLPVIHASHGRAIHPVAIPRSDELVLVDGNRRVLWKAIRAANIDTLVYAGHSSNMCIPFRPIGIQNSSRWVENAIFVRDASVAVSGTHDPELVHDMAVYQIELMWGSSTTTDAVIQAVKSR